MKDYLLDIDAFYGGLADDSRRGGPGSFRYGLGNNYRDDSGYITVNNKPVKDSGATVDQLVTWMDKNPANGDVYMAGSSEIYKETGGTYSVARTLSSDSPNGQGLAHFDGYLYYMTDTQIGRFDYASTWTDNWQTGLTSSRWHPTLRFQNKLLVGHGRYVGYIDDLGSWTSAGLTLPPNYYARSMYKIGRYAAILATYGEDITDSEDGFIFLWNGLTDNADDTIPLNGNPHAGISVNNKMINIVGDQPKIVETQGGPTEPDLNIPDVGVAKTAEVYPGAIATWRGMVFFGISDGTSTTVPRAVYSYGKTKKKFPYSLNAAYPTSEYDSNSGNLTGTGVQITALLKVGTTLRFAWKDGSTYGVDEIDTTDFLAESVYRSMAFDNSTPYDKTPIKITAHLTKDLQANETVTMKVSPDPYDDPTFTDTGELVSRSFTTSGDKKLEMALSAEDIQVRSEDLHVEVTLAGTGSTRPRLKRLFAQIQEDDDTL